MQAEIWEVIFTLAIGALGLSLISTGYVFSGFSGHNASTMKYIVPGVLLLAVAVYMVYGQVTGAEDVTMQVVMLHPQYRH